MQLDGTYTAYDFRSPKYRSQVNQWDNDLRFVKLYVGFKCAGVVIQYLGFTPSQSVNSNPKRCRSSRLHPESANTTSWNLEAVQEVIPEVITAGVPRSLLHLYRPNLGTAR